MMCVSSVCSPVLIAHVDPPLGIGIVIDGVGVDGAVLAGVVGMDDGVDVAAEPVTTTDAVIEGCTAQ